LGRRSLRIRDDTGLEHKTLQKPVYHDAYFLSLLVQGKAIQYYNLYTVTKIKFMNELMQQDLRHLLTILLQALSLLHPVKRMFALQL
jgi:hypothetical protein